MSAGNEANRIGRRKDIMQKAMRNDTSSNEDDDTFEDLAGSANNSIIGKVKSRVSSIIPSSLSKWFSPSTRNNDSLNGSFRVGTARRRRRLEIEDDDEYVDDDDGDTNEDCILLRKEFNENLSGHVDKVTNDLEEGDSDKSEDGLINESVVSKQRTHRTVKPCGYNQPPSKRSRISVDASSIHHPPLVASTPAISISHRNINHTTIEDTRTTRPASSNIEENVYNYKIADKIGPYSLPQNLETNIKPQQKLVNNEKDLDNFAAISSRRTLHLPSTSQAAKERELSTVFPTCQRQSISGNTKKADTQNPAAKVAAIAAEYDEEDSPLSKNKQPTDFPEVMLRRNINGNTLSLTGAKKQRLNGTDPEENNADGDSVSESSEDLFGNGSDLPNNIPSVQRKTGLFNMSNLNSQNGNKSRTSSFGNGINFYSHLEGRKSLFSGTANTSGSANVLNNSTLSLTSLNRRQFNASIYGSTSALSDSRLLNTFSPFYKGKTTYGGAAAYKKYSSGTGANKIFNITPTIIRPTSSLSTLSSSNNSTSANAGAGNASGGLSNNGTENPSAISSTAKRILDLINDFATPLSEAKKMANSSVKTNLQLLPQAKSRLNESDLQASRAIRLSQVRTPYTRPAVTLLPTIKNTILPPPVKELQVPSMSQLLQMKKMQSTTERSRQITMQNSSSTTCSIAGSGEYILPVSNENITDNRESSLAPPKQQQQTHTNKIKSKVRSSARVTASKNAANLEADEAPVPISLPNIAFPLMQSVPKFDIDLPKPIAAVSVSDSIKFDLPKPKSLLEKQPTNDSGSSDSSVFKNKNSFTFSANSNKVVSPSTGDKNYFKKEKKSIAAEKQMNFKFSAPFTFVCDDASASAQQNLTANTKIYTFSPPKVLSSEEKASNSSSPAKHVVVQTDGNTVLPQLKSGSVLDALKKPFSLLSSTKETNSIAVVTEAKIGFGDQFTKAAINKWECGTCLIRNESNVQKCVACETPRSKPVTTTSKVSTGTSLASASLSLGAQFKKSSDEWECDVCMIRNKQHVDKCLACETPRKEAAASTVCATSKWQSNSFGDAFKPKSNTWECPTCLINNKSDCSKCVACQTKQPGRGNGGVNSSIASTTNDYKNTTQFKFGFGDNTSASFVRPTVSVTFDSGFKSIATSQMSAKWECDACMTRNDAARNKCVCCEQAKPGTTTPDVTENGPKFAFGTAATSKFTFGFGGGVNGTSTTETGKVSPSVTGSNQKTDQGTAKGFVFGNTPAAAALTQLSTGAGGFSFGIKPSLASSEKQADKKNEESKDVADNGNSSVKPTNELTNSGFKFTPTTSSKDGLTNNATSNFNFGVPSTAAVADASSSMPGGTPSINSNSKTSAAIVGVVSTQSTSPTAAPSCKNTSGSFIFGNSSTATTATQPSTGGFSIGKPAKTTGAPTTTNSATTTTFSLGSSIFTTLAGQASAASTTTTSTATIKPMFSFGSTTTSTKPVELATKSPIASTSSSNSSLTASAFSKPTGGFNFGSNVSGCSSASTATKPIFGGFVAPTTVSKASTLGTASAENSLSTASINVFGSFGSTSSATTTTTSVTPTVVSPVASTATNANLFGNLGQAAAPNACDESKPTASATMIFGSTGNATNTDKTTTATTQATAAPFIFGSSSSNSVSQGAASNTTTSGSIVASATSWPKGGFAFGSGTSNASEAQKPIFGSFASAAGSQSTAASGSVFGSLGGSSTTPKANTSFGSVAANATSPSTLFNANASTIAAVAPTPPSLFGSVSAVPSSFGAPPTFGSSGNNNANSSTLTFGVTASSATFGSLGAAAPNVRSDGASAPKKSEPAFNFGGNNSQMGSSGGFNFGAPASAVVKPAFNFTASSAPAFNFTGSSSDTAKPFQFGAAPPAPVFNFSSGAVEATPNAPFQFNAGTTPAPSNIFAPTPSGSNAPGAMQARRKIRQPTRRLTPR